jgi:hypothetical protein
MTAAEIREGAIKRTDNPKPAKSPEGFEWPVRPISDATMLKFQTALTEHMRASGMEMKDLAIALYGAEIKPSGILRPLRNDSHRFVQGKNFPTEQTAKYIASVLKCSLADLLRPKGELVPMKPASKGSGPKKRRDDGETMVKRKYSRKANGNGHGNGEMHDDAEMMPAPIPLPEGTTPAVVKFETHPTDPRFANVTVAGTMLVEQAMSVIALIHRNG